MDNPDLSSCALAPNQQIVALNQAILGAHGIDVDRSAHILDFGCGSGRHTYEYLDAGYKNVAGFDAKDYVALRQPADRVRFRFFDGSDRYRIPFDDNSFDLVVSTSVFEHVTNQAETIAEIARILKPDGVTLHVFPSRWRPIEPHIFVPFSGAIQNSWWLRLWAYLGIRNQFQHSIPVSEVVARNREYCKTGIRYPTFHEIDALWRRSFGAVEYAEQAFLSATRTVSTVSKLALPICNAVPPALNLYRFAHTRVVLARQPRSPR